jgi:hypothetical protein
LGGGFCLGGGGGGLIGCFAGWGVVSLVGLFVWL